MTRAGGVFQPAKHFRGEGYQGIDPALVFAKHDHAGIGLAQGGGGRRVRYQANSRTAGGFEGTENRDERVAGSRTGDRDVAAGQDAVRSIAAESHERRQDAFALPTSDYVRGEFRISRD